MSDEFGGAARAEEPAWPRGAMAGVRGFNYVPSFCRTGFELWTRFDEQIFRDELKLANVYLKFFI